jgi:hypothetical protein
VTVCDRAALSLARRDGAEGQGQQSGWSAGGSNLEYRRTHAITKWGGDNFSALPPPLFLVQLVVRDGEIQLAPSLEDVR